jgi:hypothetical protein
MNKNNIGDAAVQAMQLGASRLGKSACGAGGEPSGFEDKMIDKKQTENGGTMTEKEKHKEETLGTTAEEMRELTHRPHGDGGAREFTITPEQEACPRGCAGHLYWVKRSRNENGELEPPKKHCYECNEDWLVDGESDLEKLQRDFEDAINYGLQDAIVSAARNNLKEEFALEDDFFELKPSQEAIEQAARDELAFTDEATAFAKLHPTDKNVENFLTRLRLRYCPKEIVQQFTRNLRMEDSVARTRSIALIWATWKGWNKMVHYAANKPQSKQVVFKYQRRREERQPEATA